jgi:hypothetical protein
MEGKDEYRLPRGRQVYDAYNGARVGAIVGALVGAIVAAITSPSLAWLILVTAPAGAGLGYLWERKRIAEERAAGSD